MNQYETEQVRLALEQAGFATVPFSSASDVYVINTCTVTAVADAKCRAAIRRAHRQNPNALLVVTGCFAELEPDQIAALDGVDIVVPNSEKSSISRHVMSRLGTDESNGDSHALRSRTRALVKVQDGCDHFCTYCIVPHARPVMQSRPVEEVLKELASLAENGFREVVLAGIRLGTYADRGLRLPELIRRTAEIDGIRRIRLSSIEPWEVDDALLDAMQSPKVCRHLHIPLQSGSDEILLAMGRPYNAKYYETLADKVRERVPGIGITTDVMVGFPGETEGQFRDTVRLIERVGFSRLHVFRYSPRDGTPAASMPSQVDPAAKKSRSEELVELGRRCMSDFARSLVGQSLEVLVEREIRALKRITGYADNYAEVSLPGDFSRKGDILRVRITGSDQEGKALGIAE